MVEYGWVWQAANLIGLQPSGKQWIACLMRMGCDLDGLANADADTG
jgi:hypothetical protein